MLIIEYNQWSLQKKIIFKVQNCLGIELLIIIKKITIITYSIRNYLPKLIKNSHH